MRRDRSRNKEWNTQRINKKGVRCNKNREKGQNSKRKEESYNSRLMWAIKGQSKRGSSKCNRRSKSRSNRESKGRGKRRRKRRGHKSRGTITTTARTQMCCRDRSHSLTKMGTRTTTRCWSSWWEKTDKSPILTNNSAKWTGSTESPS